MEMSPSPDHDTSFLARSHAIDRDGSRVRLRLARRSDAPAVLDLLAARGVGATELDVRRLLSYDPSRQRVLCACMQIDGRDQLVGLAAIDLVAGAEPDTLVIDEAEAPGLAVLLGSVLERLVAAHGRRAA